jgi:Ca-activated chloride channel family protein
MSEWLTHPTWAPALLGGWLALAGLRAMAARRGHLVLRRLGGRRPRSEAWRDGFLLGAALALAVALLGPRFGTRSVEIPGHGIDVVVLLDVSRSMDASDTPPSRLARARRAATALIENLRPGDRAALAVFAGHAALLTPLTADHRALLDMLPALDSEMMSDRGSRLERGVAAALGAFDPRSLRPGVIVALGDGERGHHYANTELDRLRRSTVRFVAGAIGSAGGSSIPVAGGVLHDANGLAVHSRRDVRGFERLAEATEGAVFLADAWGDFEPGALRDAMREGLVPGPGGTIRRELPVTHVGLFAALAFLLIVAEALAGTLWVRRLVATLPALGLASLLVAAAPAEIEEIEARVRSRPDDASALIALGMARAREGDPAEAARAFAAAVVRAKTPSESALASYDLGVALLEAGDPGGARDAFFDAIALAPEDAQAKFNLEWALRALADDPPLPPESPNEAPPDEPPPSEDPGELDSEAPMPEPAEFEEPEEPKPNEPSERLPREPAPLSPEEISRWLDSVEDRPQPAFRAALEEDGAERMGPQW